jgi:hypothetical protein
MLRAAEAMERIAPARSALEMDPILCPDDIREQLEFIISLWNYAIAATTQALSYI